MAASRGVSLLVLLLCCWQGAELQPLRIFAASSTELPSSLRNLDDDMATVFDEILVQEMLDQEKSKLYETQRPLTTKSTKKKKEEKETIYQIKSLTVLEKIIHSLRRALGNTLKQIKKHKSLFKGAKHHKRKQSLN